MSEKKLLTSSARQAALRAAVARRREQLIDLAAELVRRPTVLGSEELGQSLVAEWLTDIGFTVERIEPSASEALADPYAGYPALSYAGRSSVVGRLAGSGGGSSLHLSGHIDVVPVDPGDDWIHDPWAGVVAEGRLWGRGAGDMKGGLASYIIAAAAVAEVCDDLRGDLVFSSVIEEECGGNGMWSVIQAGHDCDATLIGEPSGLQLAYAATGVVWARIGVRGESGHSARGGREGPFDKLARAVAALRKFEAEINRDVSDSVFAAASDWPYGMTVGQIEGGVWTSSAPAELAARVRFGFGPDRDPAEVQSRMRAAIAEASPDAQVTFEAFRARAWCGEPSGPLPDLLAAAHIAELSAETRPIAFTATNDGRYVAGPCLCFGPIADSYHGKDEWVDVDSLAQTAAVVASAAAAWLA
jgi:acetylornithine deacetylase